MLLPLVLLLCVPAEERQQGAPRPRERPQLPPVLLMQGDTGRGLPEELQEPKRQQPLLLLLLLLAAAPQQRALLMPAAAAQQQRRCSSRQQ